MARTKLPRPTDGELEILNVLWELGPCTVRKAHRAVLRRKPAAYNTVLTFLKIMTDKGLVERDNSDWPTHYRAAVSKRRTQRKLLEDLADRAFGGSMEKMVAAMAGRKVSDVELAAIRRLVDSLKEK